MTEPLPRAVPTEHPARLQVRRALWTCAMASTAFTLFAWLTTQAKTIRAGSPWQDDPYDGVVSFTQFLVPALTAMIAARALLLRAAAPSRCPGCTSCCAPPSSPR